MSIFYLHGFIFFAKKKSDKRLDFEENTVKIWIISIFVDYAQSCATAWTSLLDSSSLSCSSHDVVGEFTKNSGTPKSYNEHIRNYQNWRKTSKVEVGQAVYVENWTLKLVTVTFLIPVVLVGENIVVEPNLLLELLKLEQLKTRKTKESCYFISTNLKR